MKQYTVGVRVYRTHAELQREWNRRFAGNEKELLGGFDGMTVWSFKNGKGKRTGLIGEILLSFETLTLDTLSHECAHAAMAYCRRLGRTQFRRLADEETYCYALGRLVQETVAGLMKHGATQVVR